MKTKEPIGTTITIVVESPSIHGSFKDCKVIAKDIELARVPCVGENIYLRLPSTNPSNWFEVTNVLWSIDLETTKSMSRCLVTVKRLDHFKEYNLNNLLKSKTHESHRQSDRFHKPDGKIQEIRRRRTLRSDSKKEFILGSDGEGQNWFNSCLLFYRTLWRRKSPRIQ